MAAFSSPTWMDDVTDQEFEEMVDKMAEWEKMFYFAYQPGSLFYRLVYNGFREDMYEIV